jgi:hypothetical protein
MSGDDDTIECTAVRLGGDWIAQATAQGVYGCGPTLDAARDSITQGLAHLGITAPVTLTAVCPELEQLRTAAHAYTAALNTAVAALAAQDTAPPDIGAATGAPVAMVKELLGECPRPAVALAD